MQERKPDDENIRSDHPENQEPADKDLREHRRDWRREKREQRNRDPLQGLFWGLVLILVGALFLINQRSGVGWDVLWKYILVGLGAIFIIDGLAHYWNASTRYSSFGRFIPGIVLLFVGIAFLYGFSQWWPVVLIAVGVIILISFLFRRKS